MGFEWGYHHMLLQFIGTKIISDTSFVMLITSLCFYFWRDKLELFIYFFSFILFSGKASADFADNVMHLGKELFLFCSSN
jgi:hypothetical protein